VPGRGLSTGTMKIPRFARDDKQALDDNPALIAAASSTRQ